jgi:hypothetical protein
MLGQCKALRSDSVEALLDLSSKYIMDVAHFEDFDEIPLVKNEGKEVIPRYVRKVLDLDSFDIDKENKILGVPADLDVPYEDYVHEETRMYYEPARVEGNEIHCN